MSAQARSQIKRTPFCKFCKDIGKSQEIYQSHYPKDRPGPNGKVVCPEILAKNKRQWAMRRQPRGGDSRSNFRRQPYQKSGQFSPKVEPKNSIANWGMVNNKKFKDTISRAGRSGQIVERSTSNKFAALNEEDECRVEIVGPKVCKPKSVTGSWGKQLVIEASDEPVKFKSLKEILEEKEDAMYEAEIEEKQSSWSKKPDLSKEAIRQRLVGKRQELAVEEHLKEDEVGMTPLLSIKEAEPEKCHEDVYDARVSLNRAAYEVFNQCPVPTYLGSWADACDSDSDGEIVDEVWDSFGRPETDNSAW